MFSLRRQVNVRSPHSNSGLGPSA